MRALAGRHLREWALLLALLLACLVGAVRGAWLDRADNWFYDTGILHAGRPAADDILILAIDETSLARLGRWPWTRHRLAEVVERLTEAGAGPILLDVILSEPQRDDAGADARLAAAITRHGRVVLPVFMPSPDAPAIVPLPAFAARARLGHAQALVDRDGVIRRYLPRETAAGTGYAHVAMLLREAAGAPEGPERDSAASLVPFAGPSGHFARLPVADLLDGRIGTERLRGRMVLVGATATGLGDNLVTPLAGVNGAMPGVEFVANIVDGLRAGVVVQPVAGALRMVLSIATLLVLMVVLLLTSPRIALAATVLAILGCILLAWVALRWAGWWWPPAASAAVAALAYPLWSWRRLESSLSTMARETARIAGLTRPGGVGTRTVPVAGFLDPVESRIAAISQAVDQIAAAMVVADDGSAKSQEYREQMMRHLAHDLRSPLVSLRSLAEQLRPDGGAANAAVLARIDTCARRSLDLTEQFLLLGRAQALDATQLPEVDLVQLFHQSADDLWEDAQREGARIERRCTLDIALVRGDARLLQRALLNLGWNALRHGRPGGTVTLSLDAVPDGYLLAVHDEGAGFPPERLLALTGAYAQGSQASKGHGLGLALVQLVAQKHHAALAAERPPGVGFRVSLRLHCSPPGPSYPDSSTSNAHRT